MINKKHRLYFIIVAFFYALQGLAEDGLHAAGGIYASYKDNERESEFEILNDFCIPHIFLDIQENKIT